MRLIIIPVTFNVVIAGSSANKFREYRCEVIEGVYQRAYNVNVSGRTLSPWVVGGGQHSWQLICLPPLLLRSFVKSSHKDDMQLESLFRQCLML